MTKAPGSNDTRSEIADWLEIQALLGSGSSSATVLGVLRTEGEGHGLDESEPDGVFELEIAEPEGETVLDNVAYEFAFRVRALGAAYPFRYEKLSGHFYLVLNLDDKNMAHQIYVFMLLISGVRAERIELPREDLNRPMKKAETLFHVCASIGVAGLMHSGRTFWFGFPRPNGTNFLKALDELSKKLGFPKPVPEIPQGLPDQVKDDGIDIVGWRPFGDNRISSLVVLCQAASGNNWCEKSIIEVVNSFPGDYFIRGPYGYGVGALAIPFMAHRDVELRSTSDDEDFTSDDEDFTSDDEDFMDDKFEEACYNLLRRNHSRFGVILDRIRITQATNDVFARSDHEEAVAGIGCYNEVIDWSSGLLRDLRNVDT